MLGLRRYVQDEKYKSYSIKCMSNKTYTLMPIGRIISPLEDRASAPRQADEGAPAAWIELDVAWADAMLGLDEGDEIIVLTWLDRADREVLQVYPRGRRDRALTGVFATRSPDRPNPVGLHRVRITKIEGLRVLVEAIEALNGTPVIDIKPVLGDLNDR
jgi:tRNA-Thr(GGU) m(6)t(6)A37 methyltransferase TsaA